MPFLVPHKWWPVLAMSTPVLGPLALLEARRFRAGRASAQSDNKQRIADAVRLPLPRLASFDLTVLVEHQHEEGFLGDPAVSYLLQTDRGTLLMDMGLGGDTKTFAHNTAKLGVDLDAVDGVLITHLHHDHMGGNRSERNKQIGLPARIRGCPDRRKPCYVSAPVESEEFDITVTHEPLLIEAGFATTGPLARMFSVLGRLEEQAVVAWLEGKGLVVLTGCGHPTIEIILEMARRLVDAPIHAVVGGLHFPITASRSTLAGLPIQQIAATGKPWWTSITDDDLSRTIASLNESGVERLLLSAHDSCDHTLERFSRESNAEVEVLRAGHRYSL